MSDDEFSDFSDDQPTVVTLKTTNIIVNKEEKEKNLDLEIDKKKEEEKNLVLEIDCKDKEKEETKDTKEFGELIVNDELIKEDENIKYPLQWNDYKKIENNVLKAILVLNWVEETFIIRASLKYIYEKNEKYEYTSQSYDLKKYKEITEDFLPKLSLVYMVFNILEKCPYDELYECKSMLYISKMFKKSPKDLLLYFSKKIDSNSVLEKCLGYYALIFMDYPLNRKIEHFVALETSKKSLELLFV